MAKRSLKKIKTKESGIYRLGNKGNYYLIRVTKAHPVTGKTVFKQMRAECTEISQAIAHREALKKQLVKQLNVETYGGLSVVPDMSLSDFFTHPFGNRSFR